jgi:homospermidine synthase
MFNEKEIQFVKENLTNFDLKTFIEVFKNDHCKTDVINLYNELFNDLYSVKKKKEKTKLEVRDTFDTYDKMYFFAVKLGYRNTAEAIKDLTLNEFKKQWKQSTK